MKENKSNLGVYIAVILMCLGWLFFVDWNTLLTSKNIAPLIGVIASIVLVLAIRISTNTKK